MNRRTKIEKNDCRILLAEDEPALQKIVTLKLERAGVHVTVAHDGAEAWNYLSKNHYNLCLLDIIMPKFNGFEVLEKIKAADLKIPVMMFSNLAQPEDMERAKALGALAYFDKAKTSLQDIVNQIKIVCNI
jgi:CheY-like chemotaxis protein